MKKHLEIVAVTLAHAERVGGDYIWSSVEEVGRARGASKFMFEVARYCRKCIPTPWRRDVHIDIAKSLCSDSRVRIAVVVFFDDDTADVDQIRDLVSVVRESFVGACIVLERATEMCETCPGRVRIVGGPSDEKPGLIMAPPPVADIANVIRRSCNKQQNNKIDLDIEVDGRTYIQAVRYEDPSPPMIEDDAAAVFPVTVHRVCDRTMMAGINFGDGKSMELSFTKNVRDRLVRAQLEWHEILVTINEKVRYMNGRRVTVGGCVIKVNKTRQEEMPFKVGD